MTSSNSQDMIGCNPYPCDYKTSILNRVNDHLSEAFHTMITELEMTPEEIIDNVLTQIKETKEYYEKPYKVAEDIDKYFKNSKSNKNSESFNPLKAFDDHFMYCDNRSVFNFDGTTMADSTVDYFKPAEKYKTTHYAYSDILKSDQNGDF